MSVPIAVTGGVLTAGLLLPAVGSVGAIGNATTDLFDDIPTELEIDEPSEQSVMLDADGNLLATFFAENRIVVGFDEVDQVMRDALALFHRGLCGSDVEAAKDLNRIGGDDLSGAHRGSCEGVGEGDSHGGFATGGGGHDDWEAV